MAERYVRPGVLTKALNGVVARLSRLGVSVAGSRVLEVRGRRSGAWRRTPVNVMAFEGARYLVAPRGHTQWVRNLRVAREGRLVLGRRREPFTAVELADDQKLPLLREYLRRWRWESGAFFDHLRHDAPEAELARIAPEHPAFRIERPEA